MATGCGHWLRPEAMDVGHGHWARSLAMARDHGQWQWPLGMATGHGQAPWPVAMAVGHGFWPWPKAMARGHGGWPWPSAMASEYGHGQGLWPLAIAPGDGHWPWPLAMAGNGRPSWPPRGHLDTRESHPGCLKISHISTARPNDTLLLGGCYRSGAVLAGSIWRTFPFWRTSQSGASWAPIWRAQSGESLADLAGILEAGNCVEL